MLAGVFVERGKAMAHLITGYAGYEHIKSEDAGAFNAAVFGSEQYVLETQEQFEGTIIDNNTVRIQSGDGLMYGRHFRINPGIYEDVTIENGASGLNRIDLICMTYEKTATDETESVYLEVIKGTPTSGTAVVPSYTDGNILEGATKNQMPLYKATISGVVLSKITKMFTVIPTYKTLAEKYEAQFQTSCKNYLDSLNILDTLGEVMGNTSENQLTGALVAKEIFARANEAKNGVDALVNKFSTISNAGSTLMNAIYPVGSIYMSTTATNPSTLFGGTWEAWGSGRVPVGVNTSESEFATVEKTGGAKTHTLTTAQIPSHTHGLNNHTHSVPNHQHTIGAGILFDASKVEGIGVSQSTSSSFKVDMTTAGIEKTQSSGACTTGGASGNTAATGSGGAHNNLQPYITCYMWKRTA